MQGFEDCGHSGFAVADAGKTFAAVEYYMGFRIVFAEQGIYVCVPDSDVYDFVFAAAYCGLDGLYFPGRISLFGRSPCLVNIVNQQNMRSSSALSFRHSFTLAIRGPVTGALDQKIIYVITAPVFFLLNVLGKFNIHTIAVGKLYYNIVL